MPGLRRSFDHLARSYSKLERLMFRGALERARTAHLHRIGEPKRALLLGEGDGRFALELMRRFPNCQVVIVERSAKMNELARERLSDYSARVTWMETDATQLTFGVGYDLVTTLFFLDCFESAIQSSLIERVAAATAVDAHWLYADFVENTRGLRGAVGKLLVWLLYRVFGALTDIAARRLHDPVPRIEEAGFRKLETRTFACGWVCSIALQRALDTERGT
ncbi:MAG TPA: class I SAM-dependent methyltransferase [Polyangiaceae bacterium]|nr:class I SAM-dependent methyltransferase [Polyangiaceae bacterium]